MVQIFKIKVVKKPKIFLGIEFNRHEGIFYSNQRTYIEKLASQFNMLDCNPVSTPMEIKLKLVRTKIFSEEPGLRALIGGLMFVARNTRPDIMFSTNYVARFQSDGRPGIMKYARTILAYTCITLVICH